jgi:protein-L-isoaspartate(D-aspartate) O-methyltransferase
MRYTKHFRPDLAVAAFCFIALIAGRSASAQSLLAKYKQAREELVKEAIVGNGIQNKSVIDAIATTPRHEFVPLAERGKAYYDMALPIGDKQTISSPFIVAYMTESLDPQPDDKVLEIGTGSGYQAAVLSPLVKSVYSIEIVESLGNRAARTLRRLGYRNVHVKVGDGFKGWPTAAPFDKMIVTCSPETVPQPLIDQLREGGLMVVPVGERYQQTLYLFTKVNGKLESKALRPTLFVPMTGSAEDKRQVQPDPLNPTAVNGNFEAELGEDEHVRGWYYQRQFELKQDKYTPQGEQYIHFTNNDAGRAAHALQGFAVDGRKVRQLKLSGWIKTQSVVFGRERWETPKIGVTLYDGNRGEVGHYWIGASQGTSDWYRESETIRVPEDAREGILRIGLFGATGAISFDDIRLEGVRD